MLLYGPALARGRRAAHQVVPLARQLSVIAAGEEQVALGRRHGAQAVARQPLADILRQLAALGVCYQIGDCRGVHALHPVLQAPVPRPQHHVHVVVVVAARDGHASEQQDAQELAALHLVRVRPQVDVCCAQKVSWRGAQDRLQQSAFLQCKASREAERLVKALMLHCAYLGAAQQVGPYIMTLSLRCGTMVGMASSYHRIAQQDALINNILCRTHASCPAKQLLDRYGASAFVAL